jgi:hypothetical protein
MIFFTLLMFNYLNLGMKDCFALKFGNRVGSKLVNSQSKQNKTITTIFYVWLDNCLQTKSNADSSTVLDNFDSYLPDTVEVRTRSAPKSCPDQFKDQELADFWLIFWVLLSVFRWPAAPPTKK